MFANKYCKLFFVFFVHFTKYNCIRFSVMMKYIVSPGDEKIKLEFSVCGSGYIYKLSYNNSTW